MKLKGKERKWMSDWMNEWKIKIIEINNKKKWNEIIIINKYQNW
jgi:hypothetical protein